MNTRINHRKIAIAIGGAVAICSAGTAIVLADDSNPSNQAPASVRSVAVDQSAVAAWARTNGSTGLSPASLDRTDG